MQKILLILFMMFPFCAPAQLKNPGHDQPPVFSLVYLTGHVVIHTTSVVAIKNARPAGYSFEYSTQRKDSAGYVPFRSYVRKGISLNWYDLGNPILGKAVLGTYFFEPTYRLGNHLQFQFRGDIGLGYFSNPYDSIKNFRNHNYSLPVNPFLRVSAGLNIPVTKKFSLSLNAHFSHTSNGNFKEPNAGLNWKGFLIGLRYYPFGNFLPKYQKPILKTKLPAATLDAGIMFVPRQGVHNSWQTTRKYLVGLFIHGSKPITHINAVNATAELYYNNFEDLPGTSSHASDFSTVAGISVGNEFLLGKVRFSQQLGVYLTKHPEFFTTIYHRWGLRYQFAKNISAGFNLKVHEDVADFIDFRIQYRIH